MTAPNLQRLLEAARAAVCWECGASWCACCGGDIVTGHKTDCALDAFPADPSSLVILDRGLVEEAVEAITRMDEAITGECGGSNEYDDLAARLRDAVNQGDGK